MSRPRPSWRIWQIFLVGISLSAWAQADWDYYQYPEGPPPPSYIPKLKYVGLEAEGDRSSQSSSVSSSHNNYERIYLAAGFGIGWDYFIYHPDLCNFSVLAEPGYTWQDSGPTGATRQESRFLLNGTFNAKLLQLKPYFTSVFATATHNTHQYDFYNSVIEDAQSYGAITGYREGPVPVTISFEDVHRETTGFAYDTTADQLTLNLHARNERQNLNATDLSYQFSQYDSTTGTSTDKFHDLTSFHYLTLTDTEHFGKGTLNSTLLYDHTDSNDSASDDVDMLLDYSIEHTPHLRSFYNYSFLGFTSGDGGLIENSGRAGLQHQLYDSLSSSGDLHGLAAHSSFGGNGLDLYSGGPNASVNYTKRLGEWGRLSLGNSATYDFTTQQSSGGILLIARESHALPTGQWVRLNQPRVIALQIVTTDAAHGEVPLTENVDYLVDRTGQPWQLQRNPFSVLLSESNNTVLVTYTAQSNPSGSFSTFSDLAQIRLDLWNGMVGVYARYDLTRNHEYDPGFVLENVEEFQAGADFYRKGFRFTANYIDRHSSLFDYSSYNLSEGYTSLALPHSSIGLDFNQRWTFYPASGSSRTNSEEVTYYDFIGRYLWHPVQTLTWSVEAGYQLRRGLGFDQDLLVARTYLNWLLGKLELHLGYEYEDQTVGTEEHQRHFVFLRARRNF